MDSLEDTDVMYSGKRMVEFSSNNNSVGSSMNGEFTFEISPGMGDVFIPSESYFQWTFNIRGFNAVADTSRGSMANYSYNARFNVGVAAPTTMELIGANPTFGRTSAIGFASFPLACAVNQLEMVIGSVPISSETEPAYREQLLYMLSTPKPYQASTDSASLAYYCKQMELIQYVDTTDAQPAPNPPNALNARQHQRTGQKVLTNCTEPKQLALYNAMKKLECFKYTPNGETAQQRFIWKPSISVFLDPDVKLPGNTKYVLRTVVPPDYRTRMMNIQTPVSNADIYLDERTNVNITPFVDGVRTANTIYLDSSLNLSFIACFMSTNISVPRSISMNLPEVKVNSYSLQSGAQNQTVLANLELGTYKVAIFFIDGRSRTDQHFKLTDFGPSWMTGESLPDSPNNISGLRTLSFQHGGVSYPYKAYDFSSSAGGTYGNTLCRKDIPVLSLPVFVPPTGAAQADPGTVTTSLNDLTQVYGKDAYRAYTEFLANSGGMESDAGCPLTFAEWASQPIFMFSLQAPRGEVVNTINVDLAFNSDQNITNRTMCVASFYNKQINMEYTPSGILTSVTNRNLV